MSVAKRSCVSLSCRNSPRLQAFRDASPTACKAKPSLHNSCHNQALHRRGALLSGVSLLFASQGQALSAGLEGLKPAEAVEGGFSALRRKNQDVFDKGAEAFENSDILRTLRERSDANRDANKKALQERYCYRQAELGVGDCAGLRLIPGATKSGKQKTPEWLKAVLQKLGQLPPDEPAK